MIWFLHFYRSLKMFSCKKTAISFWACDLMVLMWNLDIVSFLPSFLIPCCTSPTVCCYISSQLHSSVTNCFPSSADVRRGGCEEEVDVSWRKPVCFPCCRGWATCPGAALSACSDGFLHLLKRSSCFLWELWTRPCPLKPFHLPLLAWLSCLVSSAINRCWQ